jgi:Asp-tRNA(Asn)/Glu-tRNA(Gln) amidotransferase A subunit family amidase
MASSLPDHSIAELSVPIAARKLSPLGLVGTLIGRVEDHDGQMHAFITRTFDLARTQAREAETEIAGGKYRGPSIDGLLGSPVLRHQNGDGPAAHPAR